MELDPLWVLSLACSLNITLAWANAERCVSNELQFLCESIYMCLRNIHLCTSCVYTSVSLHMVHVSERLFVHIRLLFSVCVCVCRGSGVSQHPKRRGHGLTGVCSSLQNSGRPAATQCAYSGLEGDNRDITGPLWGGAGHLGAHQPFPVTTKKNISMTASTLTGC